MYVSNLKETTEGKIMKSVSGIGLSDVQAVYSGAEGKLWELIMGEQIHVGGFSSSMNLSEHADIEDGMRGEADTAPFSFFEELNQNRHKIRTFFIYLPLYSPEEEFISIN